MLFILLGRRTLFLRALILFLARKRILLRIIFTFFVEEIYKSIKDGTCRLLPAHLSYLFPRVVSNCYRQMSHTSNSTFIQRAPWISNGKVRIFKNRNTFEGIEKKIIPKNNSHASPYCDSIQFPPTNLQKLFKDGAIFVSAEWKTIAFDEDAGVVL